MKVTLTVILRSYLNGFELRHLRLWACCPLSWVPKLWMF